MKQKPDNTLTSMTYKDSTVYLQQDGIKDKAEMLDTFKQSNKIFTIILRVAGWFIMFIGLSMLINPLVVLFKVVPFLEKFVGAITGGVIFLISLVLSLLTIAIAWLAYRPLLSIGLLIVVGGLVFVLKNKFLATKKSNETENSQQ